MQPAAIFLFIVHLLLILLVIAAFFWVLFSLRSGLEPALKIFGRFSPWRCWDPIISSAFPTPTPAPKTSVTPFPFFSSARYFLGWLSGQGEGGGSGRRFLRVITVILTGAFCLGSAAVYTLLAV